MSSENEKALNRIKEAAATGAKSLDLSYVGLTSLPPEIAELKSRKMRDLSSRSIA